MQRGLSYCLSICRLSVSQPWGPYLASFLTHSNLESAVGLPRVSPRRREWGFKCEARLWVLNSSQVSRAGPEAGLSYNPPTQGGQDRARRERSRVFLYSTYLE